MAVLATLAAAAYAAPAGADLSGTPIRLIVSNPAGGSQAINDTIAGQSQALMNGMLATLAFVQAKRLKILAVSKPTRVALLASVSTTAETLPGFESGTWQGVMAPKDLPPAVLARISAELLRVICLRAVREQLVGQGAEVSTRSPADLSRWFALSAKTGRAWWPRRTSSWIESARARSN